MYTREERIKRLEDKVASLTQLLTAQESFDPKWLTDDELQEHEDKGEELREQIFVYEKELRDLRQNKTTLKENKDERLQDSSPGQRMNEPRPERLEHLKDEFKNLSKAEVLTGAFTERVLQESDARSLQIMQEIYRELEYNTLPATDTEEMVSEIRRELEARKDNAFQEVLQVLKNKEISFSNKLKAGIPVLPELMGGGWETRNPKATMVSRIYESAYEKVLS